MATLTLALPEAPRAQAAHRLAADCPCCGAPLVLRQHRQTEALLTGCSLVPPARSRHAGSPAGCGRSGMRGRPDPADGCGSVPAWRPAVAPHPDR
jgi:ssDNA-binding Zn-finger/Zn-ribbon topoisomerase 1